MTINTASLHARFESSTVRRAPGGTPRVAGILTLSLCAAVGLLPAATAVAQECAGYGDLVAVSSTNWESGVGAWTSGRRDVANPASFDTPNWAVVGSLPGGRTGMAAFVQDVNLGDCAADDESGVLMLDSPTIVLPNAIEVPRINIQHWYQTEFGWDGGNFKISVNGGPFALIPASAIESAPYDTELFPEFGEDQLPYSSNPLAGEAAYSGTHDGLPNGSWLQTRINLVGIAGAGDSIRLRLDFGVDCSGGAVGWYVDDVEVFACTDELPPSACGNSVLDAGEQCDDGNDFIGDGCSNTCQVEAGWACSTPIPGGTMGDPGFESGTPNPAWDESSSNPSGTPICETSVCGTGGGSGPSEGQYWAWFGGVAEAVEDSLTQSVTIPAGLDELTFDLEIPTCDSANDYLEVRLDGQRVFFVNGASARCGDLGYAPQSVAIAAYADGGSHTLQFHAQGFASNVQFLCRPGRPAPRGQPVHHPGRRHQPHTDQRGRQQ